MGRTPKPIEQLKLTGGYRPDRHGTDHPVYPVEAPDPPAYLIDDARDIWQELVPMLVGGGVMAPAHGFALAMLCNSLARYWQLAAIVDAEGVVVDSPGGPKRHPAAMAMDHAWDRAMTGLREFGLTPASLGKVQAKPPKPEGDGGLVELLSPAVRR